MTAIEVTPKEMKALADKEAKKAKRKREKSEDDEVEDKRSKKRKEREALLSQVPETDEHGIAYSKLQRRRMMKRVKRGLPPVPTPEEEEERLKQEALLKKEEEEELAGMMYHDHRADNEDEEEEMESRVEEEDDSPAVDIQNANDDDAPQPVVETSLEKKSYESDKKKRKRAKEVPADYVCQACKNKHEPIHWIYDCPDKVTVRGTNKVSKSTKGIHDPDEKKVFVSGLPFEAKRKDVDALFASCGKLLQCKLLTFPDTGRCKGQAYLTFDTAESAKKAVALNGTTIDAAVNDSTKKGEAGKARTELKLKVTKMLNRVATKKQGGR